MSDPDTNEIMQQIARMTDAVLNGSTRPRQNGFVVLVFPVDAPEGARTNYVSNCNRSDIIVALKEVVARFEGQPHQTGRA